MTSDTPQSLADVAVTAALIWGSGEDDGPPLSPLVIVRGERPARQRMQHLIRKQIRREQVRERQAGFPGRLPETAPSPGAPPSIWETAGEATSSVVHATGSLLHATSDGLVRAASSISSVLIEQQRSPELTLSELDLLETTPQTPPRAANEAALKRARSSASESSAAEPCSSAATSPPPNTDVRRFL